MRKSSSINSFLISISFSFTNLRNNPRMRVIWCIVFSMVFSMVLFPSLSVVYLVDEVISSEFYLNSETLGLEPIAKGEKIPSVTDHVLAVAILVVVVVIAIWRFSKGDSSVINH
jgi:hypothetical protein